jgi:hypothetical protein
VKGDEVMEIPISQDIRKFKTKDVGNFSFKEAGFIAAAAIVGFAVYKAAGTYEYAIPPAAIVLVFGFLKPFGLTFTQFIRTVVREQLSPRVYIWESDFEYDKETLKKYYGGDELRFSDDWDVIQTPSSEKYKPSKFEKAYLTR